MNEKKRNETLDLTRGVAILIVILGHAILSAWQDVPTDNWLYELIINFQMALLMFISGITAGYSFPTNEPIVFLKKKTLRLLVPYLCWSEIYLILNTVVCKEEWNLKLFYEAVYKSNFWFLRFLFVFFFVLFVVNSLYCMAQKHLKKQKRILLGILLTGSIWLVYILGKIPYVNESVSVWFYLWFLFGWFIFNKMEWLKDNKVLFKAAGVVIIDAMVILIIAIVAGGDIPKQVQGIIMVFAVCYLCYFTKKIMPVKLKKWIIEIGKNTLPIYAVHWCILFGPIYNAGIYMKLISWSGISYPLAVILIFIFLLVGTLIITMFMKKTKITRILLLGEK